MTSAMTSVTLTPAAEHSATLVEMLKRTMTIPQRPALDRASQPLIRANQALFVDVPSRNFESTRT